MYLNFPLNYVKVFQCAFYFLKTTEKIKPRINFFTNSETLKNRFCCTNYHKINNVKLGNHRTKYRKKKLEVLINILNLTFDRGQFIEFGKKID